MVTEITKSQIIRASGCFPIFDGRAILSTSTTSKSEEEIATYRSKPPAPWGYSDLPNILKELFKTKKLDQITAGLKANFDEVQANSKIAIVKYVASKLDPNQYSYSEDRLPARTLGEGYSFRPTYDIALRSKSGIHFVFISPSAKPVLKKSQRNLLIRALSIPQPGYDEDLFVEYFEFPELSYGREALHISDTFQYFDSADIIQHFLNFAIIDNRFKRPGSLL
ncbi:hypothetical protein [Thalassovita mangrovi]|uniref:Uncharacterized protein n=1 Tax=Thalassovita mangrovi TaxID=2692236 RepID=A0A6L8LKC1_9RHOB|nr:hypothetical protein [Thalassovita mangrovi]MYM56518.1 hypothetical protein [Thalassovita mangrovi]